MSNPKLRVAKWGASALLMSLLLVAIAPASCGTGSPALLGDDHGGRPQPASCATPNDGCPCDSPGQVVDCGHVVHQSGNYVACSMGKRTCVGSTWGPCMGDRVTTKYYAGGTVHGLGLGTPTTCTASNPCDPYCNNYVDTGPLGGGSSCFFSSNSAATICSGPMPIGFRPTHPVAGCGIVSSPPNTNWTGPCVTSSDCNYDSFCSAGLCTFYGTGGTDPSAVGVDFTLSTSCASATSTGMINICNRGNAAWAGGPISISVVEDPVTTGPPTCGRAAPQTPSITGTTRKDTCNFIVGGLAAGQCASVDLVTGCPVAGGASLYCCAYTLVVNDPASGARIPESNYCNNLSSLPDTPGPGPQVPACVAGPCGGGAPAGATVVTTPNGLTNCAPASNVITNPCSGAPYINCQQDFHCDIPSNTCKWNMPAYSDPACVGVGVDVTVGAACNDGTSQNIPVCNRGTVAIPTGTALGINLLSPAAFSAWNNGTCANLGAPSCSATLAAPLLPGACIDVRSCSWNGDIFAVVNSGIGAIAECGTACQNNGAFIKHNGTPGCNACGTGCNQSVNGTVMDPAGLRPIYGATVYIPNSSPPTFTPGVGCDTCASLLASSIAAQAVTDYDGTFTLPNLNVGSFPIVIQSGRWRRQMQVTVPACGNIQLPVSATHLPFAASLTGDQASDTAVPDMPQYAIGTGNGDATECLMKKLGVSLTEFTNPPPSMSPPGTFPGGGHIHMYQNNGAVLAVPGETTPSFTTLWGSSATLNNYNVIILPCNNSGVGSITPAGTANIKTYADSGGRVFASHWSIEDIARLGPAPYPTTVNWGTNSNPTNDLVDQSSTTGLAMANWLFLVGVTPFGNVPLTVGRDGVLSVNAPTTRWLYSSAGAPDVNIFSFDTPVGTPPASQCGRVVGPEMHVSSNSFGTFPTECSTAAMTPQELAFEFMTFQTSACINPVPPIPPPLPQTFTRDYQALCASGTSPEWEFFSWQATIPPGTNITFQGQTADTQAALTGAPVPVAVSAGKATATTATWTSDANTVAWHLANDVPPAQLSKAWLRITMTFNPAGTAVPTLTNWRQVYDCIPTQ